MKSTSGSVATHMRWKNGNNIDAKNTGLLKKYSSVVKYGLPGDQPITLTEKTKENKSSVLQISMGKHGIR